MFQRVRFECASCGEGFVDWHDDEWERTPVFCVNCGEAIVSFAPLADDEAAEAPELTPTRDDHGEARALGVLKSDGDGFRDTLPGLRVAQPHEPSENAPESTRAERIGAGAAASGSSQARSSAPQASMPSAARPARRRLGPVSAMLLGIAAGIPIALLSEAPIARLLNPAAVARVERSQRLAQVSTAIDEGKLERARELLGSGTLGLPQSDSRVATLHARLALAFVLANQPTAAQRELAAVQPLPDVHPKVGDVQRVYDALFAKKPSAPATNATPASASAAASDKPKPAVGKRELLTFARDRQHRSLLDDAERLYREVLRTHPSDAEARCGLAEVQLLRGGVADGAALFARALRDRPSHVPAWVGLADIDWLRGDSARAACRYQAVIQRFPASSYPPYIVQRVQQVTSSGASVPAASTCSE